MKIKENKRKETVSVTMCPDKDLANAIMTLNRERLNCNYKQKSFLSKRTKEQLTEDEIIAFNVFLRDMNKSFQNVFECKLRRQIQESNKL